MSYYSYKIIHLASLLLITSCLGISFFCTSPKKWVKILGGVLSLLILVSGFGLLAKLGFKGMDTWPLWVKIKIGIWMILAIAGPILAKRLTKHRGLAYTGLMLLFGAAIVLAVLQP